ncbi:hypothetical protein [Pantoea piersonii]|jgi:Na+/phosphate symporter|uniref:hypothetical protein n=1 Tax=Pantoea piersonii TaxID=2364647 RepID=UPI000EA3AC69|nr:hypothetical protein [Pantoea piersonii]MBZ6385989.1 hypothetical protein [Pantoea piersonii]MBZ6399388.1 hypothetical protein [Pantoea piersonii]MBZ6408607.1 hypothetical protein [Pantoea piersonii]MBZ6426971.1 hypothetical protein [Pantoea piersonii]NYB03766.1 hypothetical protein [Pantoea piersonii]
MTNRIDIFLGRISHISQVFLVAFAIFGYFYTVRPIYQKELLSEDIAKKEVELNGLKNELKKSSGILQSNQLIQNGLMNDIEKSKRQYKESEDKLTSINKELSTSILELKKQKLLTKKAIDNNKNLSSVFWENFHGLVNNTYLRQSIKMVNNELGESPNTKLEELYVKPYIAIDEALKMGNHNYFESAENIPSELRKELLAKISIILIKNKKLLNNYPSGFEEKVKNLKKEIKKYNSDSNPNSISKSYEASMALYEYISTQNKISRGIAIDFLNKIQKDI